MIKIGDKAPEFEIEVLRDGKIEKFSLGNYKGRWIALVFYPADFTFVCPTELLDLMNHYNNFKNIGAEVLSVSTDSVYVHKAWKDSSPSISKIEYPMGADPSGKLSKEFDIYLEEEGVCLRASFIIDPEGIIRACEVCDNNIGRNAAELLRKLQAAAFVRENHGKVCPANWKPGDGALQKNLDLAGKI